MVTDPKSAHVSCGRDFSYIPDVRVALQSAPQSGFDFICAPIANPRFKREFGIHDPKRPGAFTRSDLLLSGSDWSNLVVGKVSPWINVDSKQENVRNDSIMALTQELKFAIHLSLPAILIKLKRPDNIQLAQILNGLFVGTHVQQVWLQVPMVSPAATCDFAHLKDNSCIQSNNKNEKELNCSPWEWWNKMRTHCEYSKKLSLVLELNSKTLPNDADVERWLGEPLKAVSLPTRIFVANKKGYPVLPRDHQMLVRKLFKHNIQFIIAGCPDQKNLSCYYQYLNHLYLTQPRLDPVSQFARGYEDYLQSPLQPLMDNLESQTYEVFEKDPVKYAQYQLAVYRALLDRVPEEEKDTKTIVIMVVGAGRGPLVRASIAAAKEAKRKVKMYAVEKNPNAIVTLETLNEEEWGNSVTVISSDMRDCVPDDKADILVSELLGSFGDNELSPECLDGAQKFLKDDGISIPCKYTSYIAPIASQKLHNEVAAAKEVGKPPEAGFETPYVVRLQNVHLLADPKECFTFVHPNPDAVIDNSRYQRNDFSMKTSTVIHGIAGYFDAQLYADVYISIHPETHSDGMFSWFPIFFPLRHPVYVDRDSTVTVHFWRKLSRTKVWYEWCLSEPRATAIHNSTGRSYFIGL